MATFPTGAIGLSAVDFVVSENRKEQEIAQIRLHRKVEEIVVNPIMKHDPALLLHVPVSCITFVFSK